MKVMISLPMNGVPDEKIRERIKELKDKFKEFHIEVIDSFITDKVENSYNPGVYYLGRTLMYFMHNVDAVYFDEGWDKARGCRIEYAICLEYGIKILDSSFFNIKILDSGFSNADIFKRYTDVNITCKPRTLLCNNVNNNFEQLDLFEEFDNHIPRLD